MKQVWAEFNDDGKIIRIFRNRKAIKFEHWDNAGIFNRSDAVTEIRNQIWERTEGICEWCANVISYESMHMHEVIPRGKGGEISLENSVGICAECHIGPNGAHGDRAPRFGEKQ